MSMRSLNLHIKLNPYIEWNDTMRKFAKYFNITYYQSNLTPLQDCIWKITNNKLIISGNLSSFSLSKVYYCLDADIYLEPIKIDIKTLRIFCDIYNIDMTDFLQYLLDNNCEIYEEETTKTKVEQIDRYYIDNIFQ